ncbi:MAG TPA: hypothetical protein VK616_18345 [Flavitalea sp.]|nr:hypothetical protein [Flavitalea sp.]
MKYLLLLLFALPLITEAQSVKYPVNIGQYSGKKIAGLYGDTLTIEDDAKINFIKIGGKVFQVVRSIDLKEAPVFPSGFKFTPIPMPAPQFKLGPAIPQGTTEPVYLPNQYRSRADIDSILFGSGGMIKYGNDGTKMIFGPEKNPMGYQFRNNADEIFSVGKTQQTFTWIVDGPSTKDVIFGLGKKASNKGFNSMNTPRSEIILFNGSRDTVPILLNQGTRMITVNPDGSFSSTKENFSDYVSPCPTGGHAEPRLKLLSDSTIQWDSTRPAQITR